MTANDVQLQQALTVFAEIHGVAPEFILRSEQGLAVALASEFDVVP